MKVLVSDKLSDKGIKILKDAGLEVDVKPGMKPEELKACIGQYHGLVIRSATKVTAEIVEAAKNLKVIGRAGSGLDNVDKEAASKKGIVVMNTPGGNTITTAEHTISLMLSMARLIPQATASMKARQWEKKKFMGVELYNKTLGVIGLGAIGTEVAKRARGLEMNVIAFDPFLSDDKAMSLGIEKVELTELYKRADFITIHTPSTPDTKGMINAKTISAMKDGVRILNCARGGIVVEKDLVEAIKSGKVAGAALDVFEKEPPEDYSAIDLNEVICTPHLGAATEEAQENVATAVAEQIADYLIRGTIRHAVNFPSIPPDQIPVLMPYINLADKMGAFAAQIFEGGITSVTIEYRGDASKLNAAPITIAALKGILTPILEETVNHVNAPYIAKERGIEVLETKSIDAGDYLSLLTLRIKSGAGTHVVSGTLYGMKEPRIVAVDSFTVELVPEGTLLYINNNDRPGVIGDIGSYLGKNKINIARMHFGRESKGGKAVSVVSIDSDVTQAQLAEMKKLPNILVLKVVKL